ncbi:unnamed protein product [Lactuca virosa]|uniref:C2H2-type domain-containing protein n=1 Tax=Lactuca virosa TaxID=75947 RepID=A0AAU9NP66_9ASTR|nr:unnamed protein product [Lactuca virosa]
MESRYNGFNSQIHNHLYGTPSSSYPSDYTSFSNQILEGGLYSGRSVVGGQGRYDILLQIEKNKIREEILEKERRQYIMEQNIRGMANGGGYPSLSSLMLGHTDSHHHLHRVQPQLLHGQAYEPVDGRTAMPFQEDYVVTGHQFQRRPNINEIITSPPKAGEKQFIDMRKPSGQMMVGSKRKSPPPPSPAAAGCSSSSKKRVNELSCAICEVSATSERGLEEHLAGKKHQAKMAELKAEHTGKSIKKSPESVQMVSYEDKKPEGESSGKKFKFWCRMCKTGASSKKEMNMHRKGVSHLTNQLKRAQKSRGKSGGKRKKV